MIIYDLHVLMPHKTHTTKPTPCIGWYV